MARIIIDEPTPSTPVVQDTNVLNKNVKCGKYLEGFIDGQKFLSSAGIKDLKGKTFDILSHCNPHDATSNAETTHLVVGYVQSGKTMSFTALTALARDNGYRVIIYFAGTTTNLLNQTTKRLNKDLRETSEIGKNGFAIFQNPGSKDKQSIKGKLQSQKKFTILLPILKHHTYIDSLTELFKDSDITSALDRETVIIIDDEADQTSLNTFGRKNSGSNDDEQSTIYGSILRLRAQLPGNSYIQYTATPQANLLISVFDLLSPKSCTLLNPGEGYTGGKLFFGQGSNHDLFNGRLIKQIPEDEVYHKKHNPLKKMPKSLELALKLHILAVALLVEWRKSVDYLSMMVHPECTIQDNKKVKQWIDRKLDLWSRLLSKEDGHDDKEKLLKEFEDVYNGEAVKCYDEGEYPPFSEIEPLIKEVFCNYKTYLVNSDKEADSDITWTDFGMHILVGANKLGRGFTVEKLATTYMPRYSVGKANADTIEQRCHFFGYKMPYIKSCRVFLPEVSITNYLEYIKHEEELRRLLAESPTLDVAQRSIMLSPNLNPTRSNVIPRDIVSTAMSGMRGMSAFESRALIEGNDRVINSFLETHKNKFDIEYKYNTPDRTHRGFKMPVDEAIELLSDFRFGNITDAARKSYTIRYLKYLAETNRIDGVYFIQMAYNATRSRDFIKETKRLRTGRGFLAGRSPQGDEVYPGDNAIYGGDDTLTIQLHHFKLNGAAIDFPQSAYTIAIYYPEALATAYTGSIKDIPVDEEEED